MTPVELRSQLASMLSNANVKAFLAVIRAGEGTADANGYRRHFGGELFDSFADHPRKVITKSLGGKPISSTAAGAYQFLARTWDEAAAALALPDFSQASQDLAALFLIRRRKALDDVIAGRVESAIAKTNREWASLPGSPYGQPTRTLEQALATWRAAGGKTAELPPVETRTPTPVPQGEPMPSPFLWPAIDALMTIVPALGRIFSSGSRVAERNVAAAEAVVEAAKSAIGARNEQELVETIATDPKAVETVRQAVNENMGELLDILIRAGEFDERARAAAFDRNLVLAKETGGKWLWLLGTIAVVVILFSYGITIGVMFASGATFSDETKAMLLGQIVIFGFGSVLAFLFGSNLSNRIDQANKKDEARLNG